MTPSEVAYFLRGMATPTLTMTTCWSVITENIDVSILIFSEHFYIEILKEKTMNDKSIYIPNDNKQN